MSSLVLARGFCASLGDLVSIVEGARVSLDGGLVDHLRRIRRAYLEEASRRRVYGFCTGVGGLSGRVACHRDYERALLLEHAAGVGAAAPPDYVRAFMATRLLQLAQGHSPIRPEVAERIAESLNRGITPVVPLRGSLGASGDLAPSSHAFLCIFYGVGEAWLEGSRISCREALADKGLEVLELERGEALALINNNSWSTALLALAVHRLKGLVERAFEHTRACLEICRCTPEHYSGEVGEVKRHAGVRESIGRLRPGCRGSGRLQDPYSMRCAPMILGCVTDLISFAEKTVELELCSASENPLIVNGRVLHSCAFHGIYPGVASDVLALAASHLANYLERLSAQLLRGEITGLQEFLAGEKSPSGAMALHYTIASLAGAIRGRASPTSIHSVPTSGLAEDLVPQSAEAALRLHESLEDLDLILLALSSMISWAEKVSRGEAGFLDAPEAIKSSATRAGRST